MTSADPPQGVASADIRSVRRELVSAADERIRRVVAMVDQLPSRGDADALIAPLRPRLAQLRPARPLTFSRLLFTPLDSVIVQNSAWRRGSIGIPRTAIAPLSAELRRAWPSLGAPDLAGIDARLAVIPSTQRGKLIEVGREVWPVAAAWLRACDMPADWASTTGLSDADHASICRAVATVLSQADAMLTLAHNPDRDRQIHDKKLAAILNTDVEEAAEPLATLVATLLASAPSPERVLAAVHSAKTATRTASAWATEFVLERIGAATLSGGSVAESAEEVGRMSAMLAAFERAAANQPGQKRRLEDVRRKVDSVCQDRFTEAVRHTLALPTEGATPNQGEREQRARDLKRLERCARQIGSAGFYDTSMRTLSPKLSSPEMGDRVARARMIEILLGPDEAEATLAAR